METLTFAVLAAFLFGFGLISGRIGKSVITPPMAFVAMGLLLGPQLIGLIELDRDSELINLVAEFTLILLLFTDASRIDLKLLRRQHTIPMRLLGIGLPLTIVSGTVAAALLFDLLSFWEAAVLAVILAPTDAALGQAVLSSPRVPVRIRQAINVESGLNDGLALPILLLVISLAGATHGAEGARFWIWFGAMQIVLGPLVGIAVGFLGGRLVQWGQRTEWMNHSFQQLAALGLAVFSYSVAELVGGNGFIAAFCAGLTIGNSSRAVCSCLWEFAEAEGQLLTLLTFLFYGSAMIFPALELFNGTAVLYAILSLTVIRMLPVGLSLLGSGLRFSTFVFLAWFGPRGVASILYVLLVLREGSLQGESLIFSIVILTVLMSVFAHGLTALPGTRWYARGLERLEERSEVHEHKPLIEMPVKLSLPG